MKGNMVTKKEGARATRTNTAVKHNIKGKMEVGEKEIEPYKITDHAMEKRLHYSDK